MSLLRHFRAKHGHLNVPVGSSLAGHKLGYFVARLRGARNNLAREDLQKLCEIGFVWSSHHDLSRDLLVLAQYRHLHGHLAPRATATFKGTCFGVRCERIRRFREKGFLTRLQIMQLDALGFSWETPAAPYTHRNERLQNSEAELLRKLGFEPDVPVQAKLSKQAAKKAINENRVQAKGAVISNKSRAGENHGRARLTAKLATAIRAWGDSCIANGSTPPWTAKANELGVGEGTLRDIVYRRTWKTL